MLCMQDIILSSAIYAFSAKYVFLARSAGYVYCVGSAFCIVCVYMFSVGKSLLRWIRIFCRKCFLYWIRILTYSCAEYAFSAGYVLCAGHVVRCTVRGHHVKVFTTRKAILKICLLVRSIQMKSPILSNNSRPTADLGNTSVVNTT